MSCPQGLGMGLDTYLVTRPSKPSSDKKRGLATLNHCHSEQLGIPSKQLGTCLWFCRKIEGVGHEVRDWNQYQDQDMDNAKPC